MNINLTKEECLKFGETLDPETKSYLIDDCIKTWDTKGLWDYLPIAHITNNKIITSLMFANVEQVDNSKIFYIQRVFTVPEYRRKGYFRDLLSNSYTDVFNQGIRFIKIFVNADAYKAYKNMNFNLTEMTSDKKYYYVFVPVVHSILEFNNFINSLSKKTELLPENIKEYYDDQKRKYNIISV